MLATLLPEIWFADLSQLPLMVICVIAMVVVIKGADWLVEGAAGLARHMGMPKIIIGATIVSLGTTAPEAAVSVLAAWDGKPGLALGNGVGSIIADTGLIFGIGCLMVALPADRFVLSRQGWVQFGSGALLAVICYGLYLLHGDQAELGRSVGVGLALLLVLYLAISVRWSRQHPHGEPHLIADDAENVVTDSPVDESQSLIALSAWGLLGLVLVVMAGDGLVQSVSVLATKHWGVPVVVVASTLIAFGTSLPELIVGITAIRKGHAELLVGNIIGADILNVLFVIGASALAAPLEIVDHGAKHPTIFLLLQLPTMLAMLLLFRIFIVRAVKAGKFSRWMGLPLVMMYVAYIAINFVIAK